MIRKCIALLLSTALVAAAPAWAQEKITRLVVAFPAGRTRRLCRADDR